MTITLIHSAFKKGIDDVRAAVALIDEDGRVIDARVCGFLGSGWTGVAADSFVEAWDEWKTAADHVQESLDSMGRLLGAAQRDVTEQDDSSKQSLDTLSSRVIDRLG